MNPPIDDLDEARSILNTHYNTFSSALQGMLMSCGNISPRVEDVCVHVMESFHEGISHIDDKIKERRKMHETV